MFKEMTKDKQQADTLIGRDIWHEYHRAWNHQYIRWSLRKRRESHWIQEFYLKHKGMNRKRWCWLQSNIFLFFGISDQPKQFCMYVMIIVWCLYVLNLCFCGNFLSTFSNTLICIAICEIIKDRPRFAFVRCLICAWNPKNQKISIISKHPFCILYIQGRDSGYCLLNVIQCPTINMIIRKG